MEPAQRHSPLQFILGVLAYLLPTFPLGYVWHLVLFDAQYKSLELYRDEVIIPMGVAAMLTQGIVYSWIYPRLCSDVRAAWFKGAVRFFIPFFLLGWSFATLPVAAKYRMTSVPLFMALESAFTFIQFVVVSPLIALVYSRSK